MKWISLASAIVFASTAGSAFSAEEYIDTRWYVAPGFNYTFTDGSGASQHDRRADETVGGNLAFGRAVHKNWNLDIRASGAKLGKANSNPSFTEHYSLNVDALYFPYRGRIAPYLEFGIGAMTTRTNQRTSVNPVADIGIGLQAQFADSGAAIRGDLRWRVDFFDNPNPADNTTEYGELVPNLSVVVPIGNYRAHREHNRIALTESKLDTRWQLGLSAGWLFPDEQREKHSARIAELSGAPSYSVSASRAVSESWNAGFRLFSNKLDLEPAAGSSGGEIDFIGAVANVQYFFSRNQKFAPFLELGLGAMRAEAFGDTRSNPIMEAGLGFQTALNSHGTALTVGTRARFSPQDNSDAPSAQIGISEYLEWEVYAGLAIPLGAPTRTPTARPAPVVDTSTTETAIATAQDSDQDGVPDSVDNCPASRPGAIVDVQGCALDGDGDGVNDSIDACPLTPPGTTVDNTGCAVDDDRDGVLNLADKCPNTAPGRAVDPDGCTLPEVIVVYFDTDSAKLSAESKAKLDRVSQQLLQRDYVVGLLGGHADSRASDNYNMNLAKRRSRSVKAYLVARGVRGGNLTAQSFGERQPVADNTTDQGRALNRRVEVKILNP